MARRIALLVVALAVVTGAVWVGGRRGTGGDAGGEVSGAVTRVVDGDTIHVRVGGSDETVRYIGVDTPESVRPGTPVQCFAKRASARNVALVGGERVRLRFDAERRDRYGRLLAYVYRARDGAFVNAVLVRDGYARTLTIPPNVRHARRFATLARVARREGRGLWGTC